MTLRDLLDLVSSEKRKKDKVKSAQKIAVGVGAVAAVGVATGILFAPKSGKDTRKNLKKKAVSTIESIKDTVQKKTETVKASADHIVDEVSNAIKDVQEKSEDTKKDIKDTVQKTVDTVKEKTDAVKKEVKDAIHEITEDAHKTAESISDEVKKSVK